MIHDKEHRIYRISSQTATTAIRAKTSKLKKEGGVIYWPELPIRLFKTPTYQQKSKIHAKGQEKTKRQEVQILNFLNKD